MGSFNENCALSNLAIGYGDKVKFLFLTQNPYVQSDQRIFQRGCYLYDQWFVRTPPMSGKYDDYGRAEIKPSPLLDLVVKKFQDDVVVKPYGFNQCHAVPVMLGKPFDHYVEAAWEGRLEVQDHCTRPRSDGPAHWPTWEKVHHLLKKAGLLIHMEIDRSTVPNEDSEDEDKMEKLDEQRDGFNAQPVKPGVVCLTFVSYNHTLELKKLRAAEKVLSQTYDCKLAYHIPDRKYEPALIVSPKGALKDPSLLFDAAEAKRAVKEYPEKHGNYRKLPVAMVVVRDDVWKAYTSMKIKSWRDKEPLTVGAFYEKLKKITTKERRMQDSLGGKKDLPEDILDDLPYLSDLSFREVLNSIPYQTMPHSHIMSAAEDKEFPLDQVLQPCAELAIVEHVMAHRHQSRSLPSLGSQDDNWDIQKKILKKLVAIAEKEDKREY
jgi:hypothetical protein